MVLPDLWTVRDNQCNGSRRPIIKDLDWARSYYFVIRPMPIQSRLNLHLLKLIGTKFASIHIENYIPIICGRIPNVN